ncbi:caspase-3-like [Anopheles funestus]|uniref:caspase-3-like n=1 Tax=Anopheles funestus TaxID=62324 RepID=UPI0020C5C9D4|nr:caspase-3-like [Anopheles funestus]
MGSIFSKNKQPKGEKKKSSIRGPEMDSNGYITKSSSVKMTKQIQISQTVHTTRTSTNSITSETIRSSGTGIRPIMPSPSYTPVYKRPSLIVSADASVVRSPSNTQHKEISRPAILPAKTTTYPPARHGNVYDLSKKAYVLVFHHYKFEKSQHNRDGSLKDMEKIKKILQNYRCDSLDINENYTLRKVQKKMEEISNQDFTKYSCLIVFIMSHGGVNDTIMAHDGYMYSFHTDIVEHCTSNRTLNDKPKIFVLQACRGDAKIVTDATRSMSHKIDIVAFQSSYHGAVSYRHTDEGSFFMQAFLRLLDENNQQSIININTLLNREFHAKGILQTPTLMTTLQKELIFGKLHRKP